MAMTFYEDSLERKRRLFPLTYNAQSAGGTLTQGVAPGQAAPASALPRSLAIRKQIAELEGSQAQDDGGLSTLNALAAQYAGESFAPLQAQFLKRAAASSPQARTQAQLARLMREAEIADRQEGQQALQAERLEAQRQTEAERRAAAAERASQSDALKQLGLNLQQQQADTSRMLAEWRMSQPKPEDGKAFQRATNLRNEYTKRADKVQEGTRHAETVISLLGDPAITRDPTKQVSLVFAFGKMLDPESVVRESEYALISGARGMFESLLQKPDQIMTGARLTPQQLKSMQEIASRLYSGSSQRRADLTDYYRGIAERNKIPVEDVLPMGARTGGGNDLAAAAAAELERRRQGK